MFFAFIVYREVCAKLFCYLVYQVVALFMCNLAFSIFFLYNYKANIFDARERFQEVYNIRGSK